MILQLQCLTRSIFRREVAVEVANILDFMLIRSLVAELLENVYDIFLKN